MAKKIFTYQGKKLEELQAMSELELAELLPARQRRKIKRGWTDEHKKFIKKLENSKKVVKTHLRDMIVLPNMVGKTILVHNGKSFEQVMIQDEMIGHYLGEFVVTRNRVKHSAPGIGATRSTANISVK